MFFGLQLQKSCKSCRCCINEREDLVVAGHVHTQDPILGFPKSRPASGQTGDSQRLFYWRIWATIRPEKHDFDVRI
jgi:hypothetical protein